MEYASLSAKFIPYSKLQFDPAANCFYYFQRDFRLIYYEPNAKTRSSCAFVRRKPDEGGLRSLFDVRRECAGVSGQIRRMDGHGTTPFALLHQLQP